MRWLPVSLLLGVLGVGCNGPAATDAALCQDFVHRVCLPDLCPQVVTLVPDGGDCENILRTRSGCGSDSFTFTTPDRSRFLDCRLNLLHAGDGVETHPSCDDVQTTVDLCPDVVQMFSGGTP